MNIKFTAVVALASIALIYSCNEGNVFEQITAIPHETWNYKNIIHYDVNISDTVSVHNIYLDIRNSGDYPYSNIFLFITIDAPNGSAIKDTFEIALADKHGKWYGKGTGNLYNLKVPYKMNIKFPYRGIYQFDIQHAMWNKDLDGITDIGLQVRKIKK